MNKLFLGLSLLFFIMPAYAFETDSLAESIDIKTVKKPNVNLNYNYFDTVQVPIRLRITEKISTRDDNLHEGQPLTFVAQNTIVSKGKVVLRKGDIVKAKIKYIVSSGLNGIPYSIVAGNFEIPGINPNQLSNNYIKDGFSRTIFVLPLKWMLTPLPPAGSLTNFIKGGHATISPKNDVIIYFRPNWHNEF